MGEGGEGLVEVVFFGVFDFVVADAVEGLDEHHDGGDAGHGDFGGVVEGAGREAVGGVGGFLDGLVAEGDEVGVEGGGGNVPEALPGDGGFGFGGEAFAGVFCLGKHSG